MPRTKHLVVSLTFTLFVLLGVAFFNVVSRVDQTFAFIPDQQALLIETSEDTHEVIVMHDTTREDMRHSLFEKLKGYEEPDVPTPEIAEIETPSLQAVTVPEETVPANKLKGAFLCADEPVVGGGITSWGSVNATIIEGARVIASLSRDMNGAPFYTLQLPLTPSVSESETCLPRGMIGIALDGRIIESDTPFTPYGEGLSGYALDGFGIYGSVELSVPVDALSLDRCHGHTHSLMQGGEVVSMYHYHTTEESPYTLGCFRGEPVAY